MANTNFSFFYKKTNFLTWIIVILLIAPMFLSFSQSSEWTIKDLSINYKAAKSNIIDPNDYLTEVDKNSIQTNINQIKTINNYEIFLFIINKMAQSYSTNIEKYLNDLSYTILSQDQDRDHRTIFILYSIEDRQSRVRTGKFVRNNLSDTTCLELQEDIKDLLKSGEYSEAMDDLINSIQKELNGRTYLQKLLGKTFKVMKKILFYGLILGIMFFISFLASKKENPSILDRLKKIKKISESKTPRREIIETTCVICLELLETEKDVKEEVKDSCSVNQDKAKEESGQPLVEKIELLKTDNIIQNEEEKIEKENKIQEENEEKEFVAKLECGHSFHSKCIAQWMSKQGKCPVCREQIDKEDNEPTSKDQNTPVISQQLINIQNILDTSFLEYNFTHTADQFSWTRIHNTESHGGSSSWGTASGGASSSW